MFSPATRAALGRLARPAEAGAFDPWGLMMELYARDHRTKHHRQVILNTTTAIFGFGPANAAGEEESFAGRSMNTTWHQIAASAYLHLLDDMALIKFFDLLPKMHPEITPPEADLPQRNIEAIFVRGGFMIYWDTGIPRWDQGLKAVRRALSGNLLLFVEREDSAHQKLGASADLKRALAALLTNGPDGEESAPCTPLADLEITMI